MKKKKVKDNRGGFRPNARRPFKYGEPTQIVRFSVPLSKIEHINNLVYAELAQWEVKKDNN